LSTCFSGMQSEVQHLGGMCWGSVTESLKIRRRQEWHIRWPHFSFADLCRGISSDRHVRHSTLDLSDVFLWDSELQTHSFTGAASLMAGVNMPKKLVRFSFFASGVVTEGSYGFLG